MGTMTLTKTEYYQLIADIANHIAEQSKHCQYAHNNTMEIIKAKLESPEKLTVKLGKNTYTLNEYKSLDKILKKYIKMGE